MTTIEIDGDQVTVEMHGSSVVWALKHQVRFPVAHISGVSWDPDVVNGPKGFRFPGTYLPRVITAGTFRRRGQRSFWNVRRGTNAVVIDLHDESFDRVIVEVDDPASVVARLHAAMAAS